MAETEANKDVNISFVELSPLDRKDLDALAVVSASWRYYSREYNYADEIYYYAREDFLHNAEKRKNRYYALTSQHSNLKDLEPFSIIALAQISNTEEGTVLDYLQVNPDEKHGSVYAKFIKVGTTMLSALKTLPTIKSLILSPLESLRENFYRPNGFEDIVNSRKMIWRKL